MSSDKKNSGKNQSKPVGNIPAACIKDSMQYTKSYCKGKQNLKK